jgi:hypothetical protein
VGALPRASSNEAFMCSAASANRLTPLKDQLGAGFIRLMFDVTDEAAVSEEATKASVARGSAT